MTDWQRIIIAIDGSERSLHAVDYVASLANRLPELSLCLLHIYPEPPPGYYKTGSTLDQYQQEQQEKAGHLFLQALQIFERYGMSHDQIVSRCEMATGQTISGAILELQTKEGYGTIVVGKRGISKAEEFLFGSISNALIHNAKGIAVWVIG